MNTLFIGRHVIALHEIPSTNTYAMELLKEGGLTEGTLIRAEIQSRGRGQYGNSWQSEPGKNLTFSLVIHPVFLGTAQQFYLSKISSLAILGMLTEFLPASQYDIQIKWPNDILVNGEKIAGILIENVLQANALQSAVIGVGINVNQEQFEPLKRKAVSMAALLKKEVDLSLALERFCKHFEALYLSLRQGRLQQINTQYLHNLYLYEKWANFTAKDETLHAKIRGVEEGGLLVLETESGIRHFNFKELEFL